MSRSEMLITIVGLLGTFMLPWPGESARTEDATRAVAAPQGRVCADAVGPRLMRRDVQCQGGV